MPKPDCYNCIHRGTLPGSAHSRCLHPDIPKAEPLNELFAILAGAGRVAPIISQEGADKLKIKADLHGIMNGWFNWPFNFDPVWLENCEGFTPQTKEGIIYDNN